MVKAAILACALCVFVAGGLATKIDFETKNIANILIGFDAGSSPALDSIEKQSFPSRTAKITSIKASLENHAAKSQKNVQDFLNTNGISFRSLWITNQICVKNADQKLVENLRSSFHEIVEIREENIMSYDPVINRKPGDRVKGSKQADDLTYGLKIIEVEKAWNITNGTGVIVAHIDTGVLYTHEALRDSYQNGTHSWYDDDQGKQFPYDDMGHGTHTMGTIAGIKGVGVAPGVKWMTCKPSMEESSFLFCTQWILAPTRWDGSDPDPSKAPMLCSDSWSFGQGEKGFEAVTKAWVAAGIVPHFTSGNWGNACGMTKSPADLPHVISVGSTNEQDRLSDFSSVGPTVDDGRIKPDVTAPGEDVLSASSSGEEEYEYMSGTSMACPHISGVSALILSVNPNLTVPQVKELILKSVDTEVLGSTGAECGGISDRVFPNNHFGHGRINAYKAVQAALKTL